MAEAAPQEPTIVETDITPKYMPGAPEAPAPTADQAAALRRQIEIEKQAKEALDQRTEIGKKELQSIEEQQKATAPLYKEALDAAKEREKVLAETPVPEVPNIPPPPNKPPIDKDTAQLMGSVGLIISAIAGFGGRVNGIKMNEALGGFLNGYREGRYEDAEFARRQWHDTFEYQIAMYKMQVERQREILGRSGMKLENKVAEIELTMAPFRDYQEGLEVRDRSLATILNELRQEEQLIQRLEDSQQRIRQNELKNTIDIQKYNLDVWKAMHPNALHPTAEADKLALALKQLGLPANTPIDKLTADQAKKVNDLMKTARATTAGPAAPTTKAYQEMVQTAAQREYKRLEPIVRRDLQAQGARAHVSVQDETIKRVDKWLQENYKYKVVGVSPGMLYGINIDVAPLRKEEAIEGGPEPSTATEWKYNAEGELVPVR